MMKPALTVLLLLLLSSHLAAQQSDLHLSPPDIISRTLPDSLRLQSAASVDSTLFVAWGTGRATTGPQHIVGEIHARVIEKGLPGEDIVVTSTAARPSSVMRVLGLRHAFIVLWQDKRDSMIALWYRVYGRDGKPRGVEQMLAPGGARNGDLRFYGNSDQSAWLFWNGTPDMGNAAYAVRFDTEGGIAPTVKELGKGLTQILRFPQLEGMRLLSFEATPPIILYDDGRVDMRPVLIVKGAGHMVVAPDSSVLKVMGKTVRKYRSLFDSTLVNTWGFAALDSAVDRTLMLGPDSLGGYRLMFSTLSITGDRSTPGYLRISTYALHIEADDNLAAPRLIENTLWMNGPTIQFSGTVCTFDGVRQTFGTGNSALTTFDFTFQPYLHGTLLEPTKGTRQQSVDSDGRFHTDGTGYRDELSDDPQLLVTRLRSDSISSVNVIVNGNSIDLSSPNDSYIFNTSQTSPGIAINGGVPVVTWIQKGDYTVNVWPETMSDTAHMVADHAPSYYQQPQVYPWENFHLEDHSTISYVPYAGYSFINLNILKIYSFPSGPGTPFRPALFSMSYSFQLPTRNGWKGPSMYIEGESTLGILTSVPRGVNPGRQEVWFQRYLSEARNRLDTLYALNSNGNVAWSIASPIALGDEITVVPVDSIEYLSVAGPSVRHVRDHAIIDSFAIPPALPGAHYLRLAGDRFLRHGYTDESHSTLSLELFNLHGDLLAQTTFSVPPGSVSSIVEHPRDASLFVLYSDGGIRAAVFDTRLQRMGEDRRLSIATSDVKNAVGVFHNDTLYAAWEHARDGGIDIDGSVGSYPAVLDVAPRAEAGEKSMGIHIESIAPNPIMRGDARMTIEWGRSEPLQIRIIDAVGRVVREVDGLRSAAGRMTMGLPTEGLTPGIYTVEVSSGSTHDRARVVVLR